MSNLDNFTVNLNQYDLIVSATYGHYDDALLKCEKPNFNNSINSFSTPFMNRGLVATLSLSIDEYDPGKVTFKCKILDVGNNILDSFSAILKKSDVVQGLKSFTSLIGTDDIDTLVFMKGSYLKMGNLDKKVKVKNIISDNGILTSFLPNEVNDTPKNTDGQSGGSIEIDAEKAIGKLNVELRGKNAGVETFVPPVPAPKVAGLPGKGSPGGKPATYSEFDLCGETRLCLSVRTGNSGAHGLDGNPGKKGAEGETGKAEPSYYITNDKQEIIRIHTKNVELESWSNKLGYIVQERLTNELEE